MYSTLWMYKRIFFNWQNHKYPTLPFIETFDFSTYVELLRTYRSFLYTTSLLVVLVSVRSSPSLPSLFLTLLYTFLLHINHIRQFITLPIGY